MRKKKLLRKTWHFIWEDNSIWSWIVNVLLAFVLIKFIVYPGLGLVLSTSHPVVAVVSGSMEHNGVDFDTWWAESGALYADYAITQENFSAYRFRNGFNKGDIMVLRGVQPQTIKKGDVIVFAGSQPEPIIHRVINVDWNDGSFVYTTKGDNNDRFIPDDVSIPQRRVLGEAWLKVPFLGYVKIWFVELVKGIGGLVH